MSDPAQSPSWDAARTEAPTRPQLASSLADESLVARPRRLIVAFVATLVAAAAWIAITVLAGLRLEDITDTLTVTLAAELTEEYEEGDLERAVRVLLGAAAGLGFVLILTQVLSAAACVFRRSLPARISFVVVTVFALPVVLFTPVLYDGDSRDATLSIITIVLTVLAALLFCSPAASRWLRQREDARRGSLSDLREDASPAQ